MSGPANSAIYEGWIRHRRHYPVEHEFRYPLFMAYLDLDELPWVFDPYPGWSARRPALARFKRSDYLGPADRPLADCVRDAVVERGGAEPGGPIRLLTNLRYFGHTFNPVSTGARRSRPAASRFTSTHVRRRAPTSTRRSRSSASSSRAPRRVACWRAIQR